MHGIRIRHHEMNVQRAGAVTFRKRFDNGRADRQVRNKMPVHHVHVQQVGSRGFHRGDFIGQVRKVGGKNRRGNVYGCGTHLLRSSKSCGKKSVHIVTETGREEISVRVRQGIAHVEEANLPTIHGKIPGGLGKNEKRSVWFPQAPLSTHYRPRLRPVSSKKPPVPGCLIGVPHADRVPGNFSAISLRDGDGVPLALNRAHQPESDQTLAEPRCHETMKRHSLPRGKY